MTANKAAEISKKQRILQYVIFIQALLAMSGSLYYSTFGDPVMNIMNGTPFVSYGFTPCELCWFSRILMYPLTLISLVGLIKKDNRFTDYILPFPLLGIPLSIFHYLLQHVKLPIDTPCTLNSPCSALQVEYLGFITIPFLALTAYVVILICVLWNMKLEKKKSKA